MIRDKALQLARRGLPVFPCLPDKSPAVRGGFKSATTDRLQIKQWRWDGLLIGLRTGMQSGIAVLDVDTARHPEAEEWLQTNKRRLPVTRSHLTRSGGLHLLFRANESVRINASLIAPGIDVRGEGGYIIWWPAHRCPVLDFLPLAELPDWPDWLVVDRRKLQVSDEDRHG